MNFQIGALVICFVFAPKAKQETSMAGIVQLDKGETVIVKFDGFFKELKKERCVRWSRNYDFKGGPFCARD